MRGESGGDVRHRQIDAPSFDQIADNYAGPVREALAKLIATSAPDRGRLILWRGDPGTGKSHALRALARAWAPWCSAHFIVDPEELLGHSGAYLLDLLTWEGSDENRWRVLILEDAGELIAADARANTGQALSRLLNVADGLLGQGTRTLLLITTNEPVKHLHPATRRPGRCLADIEFTALSVEEANRWFAARGHDRRVERPTTVADLFRHETGDPLESKDRAPQFGFARALSGGDLL
jgi:SpoVK/Ycf46/Vps4 family AAA+-type ATPase